MESNGDDVIWVPELQCANRWCSNCQSGVAAFEQIHVYEALLIFVTVIVSPSIFPVTFTLSPAYCANPGAS